MKVDLLRATAAELQHLMSTGKITSIELVRQYHQQMLDHNDRLRAIISISPLSYTEKFANQLDKERENGSLRGPLHGVPFIIKVMALASTILCLILSLLTGHIGHHRRIRSAVNRRWLGLC